MYHPAICGSGSGHSLAGCRVRVSCRLQGVGWDCCFIVRLPWGGSAAKLTHGAWQASGPPDCWPETGVPCHVGFSLGQVTTGELSSLRVSTEEIVQPRPTPPWDLITSATFSHLETVTEPSLHLGERVSQGCDCWQGIGGAVLGAA